MKKYKNTRIPAIIIALFLLLPSLLFASEERCNACPGGDIILISQAEVDAFVAAYPDCAAIEGNLNIGTGSFNTDISDISGLASITAISGNLMINRNPILSNLNGLEGLISVGGNVSVSLQLSLTSLNGLERLTSVGGRMNVSYNHALTSLNGLEGLTSVGQGLTVEFNDELISFNGLEGLTSVGGNFIMYFNYALSSLSALEGLTIVGGDLLVVGSNALASLSGLEGLTSVGGSLSVYYNDALTNCCSIHDLLHTSGTIGGNINIYSNNTGCDSQSELDTYCMDMDGDGIRDEEDNCIAIPNPDQTDTDSDGFGDACDPDDDNDGCPDSDDAQPLIASKTDVDCDGINDDCDLCPDGDDSVDNNGDGIPDCSQILAYREYAAAWQCSRNKLLLCHLDEEGSRKTLCLNKNALPDHLSHNDWVGPCTSCASSALSAPGGTQLQTADAQSAVLKVYPNPTTGQITLQLGESVTQYEDLQLVVYNQIGQAVYRKTLPQFANPTEALDLSHLKPGMYLVQLRAEKMEMNKKVVVLR